MMPSKAKIFLLCLWFTAIATASDESCCQFRRKENITLDQNQCQWENYTEPQLIKRCLKSCSENAGVRTSYIQGTWAIVTECLFLPTALWGKAGKLRFSQASICSQGGGVGAWSEGSASCGWGCMVRHPLSGIPEYGQFAVGMHPTEMHSCFIMLIVFFLFCIRLVELVELGEFK